MEPVTRRHCPTVVEFVIAVNADVPFPWSSPVSVVAPEPPCATVTAALDVRMVADALGSVNVFKDVAGPVKAIKALFVPPFPPGSVPVTPDESGRPVQFVSVPLVGVPSSGVVSVGDVARTGAPDPVAVVHTGSAEAPPPTRYPVS